jgi:hypothetical protein
MQTPVHPYAAIKGGPCPLFLGVSNFLVWKSLSLHKGKYFVHTTGEEGECSGAIYTEVSIY